MNKINSQRKRLLEQLIISLCFAFLFVTPTLARASDYQSPRTVALGGAGHAGPLLNDSIFLNPSYVSFLPTYSVSGSVLFFKGTHPTIGDNYHGRNYNVSIQDGRTETLQAAISYTLREDGFMIHLGVSKAVLQSLGFALSGKFYGTTFGSPNMGQDITFSTTFLPNAWMQTALIVDNILENDQGLPKNIYREITLGTKFNLEKIVLVYADPHYTPNLPNSNQRFGYELGMEFIMMSDFMFRVGMFQNSMIAHQGMYGNGYGAGVGFLGPKISLDYGLQRVSEPYTDWAHSFGATIYF